jgi:hypothetical protein
MDVSTTRSGPTERPDTGGDTRVRGFPLICKGPGGRIDVAAVVARLRHIDASAEPALVFSQLAETLVPGVCDDVVIDLVENDQVYRIRRPAGASDLPRPVRMPPAPLAGSDNGPVVGPHLIMAAIESPEDASIGPAYSGSVICRWRDGYSPVAADASLVRLMIDHAVGLIHRERLTGTFVAPGIPAEHLRGTPARDQRITSAVGVVMALHHVDSSTAMELLIRISRRTGRGLADLVASVADSGTMPPLPGQVGGATPESPQHTPVSNAPIE